jgi:hypothetical protein
VYTVINSSLVGFSLQPNGTLQPLPNVASPARLDQRKLAVTPNSQWLFSVTGSDFEYKAGDGSVYDQSIAANGQTGQPQEQITPNQQTASGPTGADSVMSDDSSRIIYTLSQRYLVPPIAHDTGCSSTGQDLNAYALGPHGGLQLSGSVQLGGNQCPMAGSGLLSTLVGITADSSGRYLWYTSTDWGRGTAYPWVAAVSLNSDGSFGATKGQDLDRTQAAYTTVAGTFLVVSELQDRMRISPDTITTFATSGGKATFASQCATTVPACHHAVALVPSRDGKYVYTISKPNGLSWSVNALLLNPGTGTLLPIGNSVLLSQAAFPLEVDLPGSGPAPMPMTLDSSGRYLFVLRGGDAKITTIPVDPVTGILGAPVDSNTGAQSSDQYSGAIVSATR